MKRSFIALGVALLLATVGYGQTGTLAQPPAPFIYQGKLTLANGDPANGNFDMVVQIYGVASGGTPLAEVDLTDVPMANGVFSIPISLPGDLFSSRPTTFLDLQVSPAGAGNYTQLSPRLQIGSTPYSQALNCVVCVNSDQIVSVDGSKITGTVANASNAATATSATSAYTVTGIVGIANGGTGSNVKNFVDLANTQTVGGNKTFTGVLSGNGSGLINVPGTLKWNVSSAGSVQAQSNNGYVLTNAAASTISLPATPAVGDVVRVIEKGTGGFTVAMNSGQSILDWATTHLETSWTRQYSVRGTTTLGNPTTWSSVASSTDGSKLVGVQYPGILATSINSGQTWAEKIYDSDRSWTSVASSADGTKLIASVEGGHLFTSTDSGDHWTERMTDLNRYWYSVASSADGQKLIAAAFQSVYTSANGGITWTLRRTPGNTSRVASSADGTKLVVGEFLGDIYTSTDSGATWIDRYTPTGNSQWQSVASDATGTKLVAVRNFGPVLISSDSGVTWTSKTIGPSGDHTNWSSVSVSDDGTRIVAVGPPSNPYPGSVNISYDGGNSWTMTGVGTSWTSVALAGNGTRMSAAMFDNSENRLYSGPIQTITVVDTLTGIKDSAVELVYLGSNQFAMVSSSGMTIPPHTYRGTATSR